jgi:MFS family permease
LNARFSRLDGTLRPGCGAKNFLLGVLFFGAAFGAFYSVLNNFMAEIAEVSAMERGVVEFFRETPGLLLIFILALMHRFSEWKILRVGTLIAMVGVAGMFFATTDKLLLTALIMIWSTGEHILMPARNSIAMHLAQPGKQGAALGLSASAGYTGNVAGSVAAALIFGLGAVWLKSGSKVILFNAVWLLVLILLGASLISILGVGKLDGRTVARPRLHFHRKFTTFYVLELFYGARKQIFLTFAPYVLIKEYGMSAAVMSVLVGLCAAANIYFGPQIGRLIDRWGYRNVMIYDTVALFFVCLVYGFADRIFAHHIAVIAVCVNYLLDAVISTASMAASVYVKEISDNAEEVTATLTTGISVNHLISVFAALLGGWIWSRFGVETLFVFAGVMALGNSLFAAAIKPRSRQPIP